MTTTTQSAPLHVCCACGRHFESIDCLANWCDRCVLHATQGRTAEQVAGDWVVARLLFALLAVTVAVGLIAKAVL